MTEFRILGAVEVRAGGRLLEVGRPQQCLVLAALLVDAGRFVPMDVLVDRVWGDAPPERARRTLYTHVTRVRRQLTAAGDDSVRLLRRSGGYLLQLDPDRVDLHRFASLVSQATEDRRSDAERVALLHQALGLWRGEALAGLPGPPGSWVYALRERCRQQRLDAVLAWAPVELARGNTAPVIGVVSDLIREHPLVEPLTAALMRALHAAGRDADALRRYADIRRQLVSELGAEPGTELQALQQAILRGDTDAAGRPAPDAPAGTRTSPAYPVPAQLPLDIAGFTARRRELVELDRLAAAGTRSTAVVISAVSGMAGIGKTALAVHWAHSVRHLFPDGQLYVNLRGFDPGARCMAPAEAIRGFLDALMVPADRIPASVEAQAALYRSLLAEQRVLILLDSARDADQVRPLLPGTPTALVVVTSRSQLTSLVANCGAYPLTLDLLTPTEARELLARRLGMSRLSAEPEAVAEIIALCARLPLALAIVAARAARSGFPLASLAAELADADRRLDALSAGDSGSELRAAFSWSYSALTPAAARLFRLIALHPGPDISEPAAASLAGLPSAPARRLLAELVGASMLAEPVPARYALHDLLRAYSAELAHSVDTEERRRVTVGRMLDHYLHTAHSADRRLDPNRDPIALALAPPRAGVTPERPADSGRALAWMAAEHPALLAIVRQAAEARFHRETWQLAWALDTFLDRQGHWPAAATVWQSGLDAAHRLGDPPAQALAHRRLARAYTRLGRYQDAYIHYRHALDLSARIGDRVGQAHAQQNLSFLSEREGRYERALDHTQQALKLYKAAGHRQGQAMALSAAGWCHALLGDPQRALSCCRKALTLLQQLGDCAGQAATWDSLGYVHHHLAHHSLAVDCYQQALRLYRDLGDRYNEADVLSHLGDTHDAAGNPAQAHATRQHAIRILTELDEPGAEAVRSMLHDLRSRTVPEASND